MKKDMKKGMKKIVSVALCLMLAIALSAQGFESTSTLMGSGSNYSSNPTLSDNGMAAVPAAVPNRGRTGVNEETIPTIPDEDEDTPNPEKPDTPIGDAVLPLLLLAGAYGFYAYRRRKAVR